MRKLIVTIVFFASSLSTWGQIRGQIIVNGRGLEVPEGKPSHFKFRFGSTSLDYSSKIYLNFFGEIYTSHLKPTDTLVILLDPGLTAGEQEMKNSTLRLKRARRIAKYVANHFDIEITKVRFTETITACRLVAVLNRKGYRFKNIK